MTPSEGEAAAEEVDVVEASAQWRAAGIDPDAVARAGVAAAAAEIGAGPGSVAVVFADDELVRKLNAQFRGQDAPTNVLAFPAAGPPTRVEHADVAGEITRPASLGDVVLAFETVAREAAACDVPLRARALHMVVHGFLHLHGYDHQTDNDAEKMEWMERKSLARLGVADPYEADADA